MGDIGVDVLKQHDFTVSKTIRGRGALVLETTQGYKLLKEYKGTVGRLEYLYELTEYLYNCGAKCIDTIVKNSDGLLLSTDECGDKYIVTDWYYGNECDVKSRNNVKEAVKLLAFVHNITKQGFKEKIKEREIRIPETDDLRDDYDRHNRELRRSLKYIRGRKHKTGFEYSVLKNLEENLYLAGEASYMLAMSGYKAMEENAVNLGSICHGNYNYHNVIFAKNKVAVVNFDRSGAGVLIKDLYLFFRKVMEKYDWESDIGHQIIDTYDKVRPIPKEEYELFKIMLAYPEKFWKLVNHYFNSNKSWIPDKSMEKLETVCHQQEKKNSFIKEM